MDKEIVLEVRDDISEKNTIFHMFSYLTLASGALFLVIIVIADNKMLYIIFIMYFLMPIISKCIDI